MKMSDNIRHYRDKAGMLQSELGKKLGVSAQAVSKWELGKAEPDRDCIAKMCSLFGISANELMGIETEGSSPMIEGIDEAIAIRERLRRDPSYRLLFSAADNASPEHLRAAAAMLKALGPDEDAD